MAISDRAMSVLGSIRDVARAFSRPYAVQVALRHDSLDSDDREAILNEFSHFYHNERWKHVMRRRQKNRRVS